MSKEKKLNPLWIEPVEGSNFFFYSIDQHLGWESVCVEVVPENGLDPFTSHSKSHYCYYSTDQSCVGEKLPIEVAAVNWLAEKIVNFMNQKYIFWSGRLGLKRFWHISIWRLGQKIKFLPFIFHSNMAKQKDQ